MPDPTPAPAPAPSDALSVNKSTAGLGAAVLALIVAIYSFYSGNKAPDVVNPNGVAAPPAVVRCDSPRCATCPVCWPPARPNAVNTGAVGATAKK